jgi:hypothetical protein
MPLLPAEYRPIVTGCVSGVWLPIDVAVVHYNACDRLQLATRDVLEIGREVTKKVHGTALRTFLALARELGVSPWTALERATTLWARCWEGGEVTVKTLGPKEARIEIAGWPCAAATYCRVACRGMLAAVLEPFCAKVYVREDPGRCSRMSLGYVAAWA